MTPFDPRPCRLGEGPLWHPLRQDLFWFDILSSRLLVRSPATGQSRDIALPEMFSAAGWVDERRLFAASETGLWLLDVETGALGRVAGLEADRPATRANDGRADPWGGFWIGTMGKEAEPGAGALYRWYRGQLRQVVQGLSIPNATCFAPDRSCAYFADTARGALMRLALDGDGWPRARPELLVDFAALGLNPDGAVTRADGVLMVALWGAGAVIEVRPDGRIGPRHALPAPQTTCPAYGGAAFDTLFCTSASEGMSAAERAAAPLSGATFALEGMAPGLPEPAVDHPAA
ncbi:SMP-30/gluconolactonase/LRE family protein [Plastorhodobacter daqingensis]|uniref:SMP-30/gluconolactonase/LRE family protein n=1 Tax=Plastorhodobacter daqingensis TaxID=1387281 RepID=A0ABW2UMW5_9RHOB